MSKSTKRKHVTKEVLDDFELPGDNQKIVRVVGGRGNNLHQVMEADETTTYLVSMPTKFRKNVWIKRGDFCVVEPIEEGDKVKAEITRILYKDQIRYIRKEGQWPFKDAESADSVTKDVKDMNIADKSDEDDLFENPNRPKVQEYSESDSSTDDGGEQE